MVPNQILKILNLSSSVGSEAGSVYSVSSISCDSKTWKLREGNSELPELETPVAAETDEFFFSTTSMCMFSAAILQERI